MFRNGFVKIFLAALDFQPDGLMDMQASRLKIATALPFVGRYRGDQLFLWKIRFDCAPLARLRVYKQKY